MSSRKKGRFGQKYVIDEKTGRAIECPDPLVWEVWMLKNPLRQRVKLSLFEDGKTCVSTVFVGSDFAVLPEDPPLIYETIVFAAANDDADFEVVDMRRTTTQQQAINVHNALRNRYKEIYQQTCRDISPEEAIAAQTPTPPTEEESRPCPSTPTTYPDKCPSSTHKEPS